MRVSRRWLGFTLVLPVVGLLLLVRAGQSGDTESGERTITKDRATRGASRIAGEHVAAATGRLEAGARSKPADERSTRSGAVELKPAPATTLAAALRPLIGKLHEANEKNDDRAIAIARAELAEAIARDPSKALAALLAEFRAAGEDESTADTILRLMTEEPSLPRQELLAALSDMARHDEVTMRRQAALHGLGRVGADEARVTEIAELGRRDREVDVRDSAASALGELADRAPGPLAQAAAREVVTSLATESDPRVRASLVYALRDTREASVADALLRSLADSEGTVRLAAADMLGDVAAAHRERAVTTLAERFARESEPEVRRTIVTAIVRAGRIGSIATLEKLKGGDSQQLIDDFLAGLRSGEDNMEKLYAIRFAREKARGKPE